MSSCSSSLWGSLRVPPRSFDWALLRPSSTTDLTPPWLSHSVRDHVLAHPDPRVATEGSGLSLPTGDSKSQRAGAASGGAAAAKTTTPAAETPTRTLVPWRGVLAALQPVFSVPTPGAWSTQPAEPVAAPKAAVGGSKASGAQIPDTSAVVSKAAPRTVFAFLPAVPPLFSEWSDWEHVPPVVAFPSPAGFFPLLSDESHAGGDAGGAATSSSGAPRLPGKPLGKPAAAVAVTASAALIGAPPSSKHVKGDSDAASQRKPRWLALLHSLSTERKLHGSALCNGPAAAVAGRVASFLVWSALLQQQQQQQVPQQASADVPPLALGGTASAAAVSDLLLDSMWLARLCRAALDASAACSALGMLCPALPSSDSAATGKTSPRFLPRSASARPHNHASNGAGAACDSCELLVHTSIVLGATVLRSGRAAELVGALGPVVVDSLLAAAVPAAVLLSANPALAAHAPLPAPSLDVPPCSPSLPPWWDGEGGGLRLPVRLWCAEALRCLALCDRVHRVTEIGSPSALPLPLADASLGGEKGTKAPKTPVVTAAPNKDAAGKKSAKPHKTETAFDAASVLAAVSGALKPVAPAFGSLLPGLDSESKVLSKHSRVSHASDTLHHCSPALSHHRPPLSVSEFPCSWRGTAFCSRASSVPAWENRRVASPANCPLI